MSYPIHSLFQVTAEDIRSLLKHDEWETLSLSQIAKTFRHLAYGEGKDPDAIEGRVYRLLYAATSFLPNFAATGNPFGCWWQNIHGPGTRSYMAEDLTEADIDALEGIVSELLNPELQARIADVVWECRKKSHTTGQTAVRAYLASADRLKIPGHEFLRYVQCLGRAAQLAQKMNRKGELYQEVLGSIKTRIQAIPVSSTTARVCGELIVILIRHKAVSTGEHAPLVESYAAILESECCPDLAENFWHMAKDIYSLAKNTDESGRCQLNAAECLVAKAEKGGDSPHSGASYMAGWMQRALEALRLAKAAPERIKEIHLRLLELQKQSLSEFRLMDMNPSQMPGFEEWGKESQAAIQADLCDLSFQDSIAYLANQISPTNYEQCKTSAEKQLIENVWSGFATVQLDHSGKVAENMKCAAFGNYDEETLKQKMLQMAREVHWPVAVDFLIEPARQAIMQAHNVRFHDLAFLVTDNSFVKEGREGLYLRGIQAGFYGDWALSTHFLIPQLEESIRQIIRLKGGITSTLKSGVQMERDMNEILWMPEVEEAFGPDILFDLCGILIEHFGHNLRNDMAHGLLDESGFYSAPSVYLWWLTIRLCWQGHCIALAMQQEEQAESGSAD
jgi:hypothetical protein